jgi:homoserine dehydrogenase
MSRQLNIGLFGFGVAGEGLYKAIQKAGMHGVHIRKICVKHETKTRNAPAGLFTTNKDEILNDPSINVIVEATNDADAAFTITITALGNGKHVVSAGKKMIARNLAALLQLQQETGCSFLYEASVCAAIPIIRNLEEYYRYSTLRSIRGIVNGSCNYILTKMLTEGAAYTDALKEAQAKGFAETDPVEDVAGFDAASKLQVLLFHACGVWVPQNDLLFSGISNIHATDITVAKQNGWQVKLVAQLVHIDKKNTTAWVLPQFVTGNDPLFGVNNEYNGIVLEDDCSEKQFFYGRGAGSKPTATALLQDVLSLQDDYHYHYTKNGSHQFTDEVLLYVYCNFNRNKKIPEQLFSAVHEWQMEGERQFITGSITYKSLKENNWWRHQDVSLILLPEGADHKTKVLKPVKKLQRDVLLS